VTAGALPEREPHPGAFLALEALIGALAIPEIWPAVYVRFEGGLLESSASASTCSGAPPRAPSTTSPTSVPRTGRAVSRAAGEPYKDRLLPLPPFMLGRQAGTGAGDVGQGLDITARFLNAYIFGR
jgi:DNA repair protein RecO (recombination protein O)